MIDVWEQLVHYRKLKTLPSGNRVLIRPLCKDDGQNLEDLFDRASEQDLELFRSDARNPAVIKSWIDHLNLKRIYSLVAVVDDTIVGDVTLHLGDHYDRHRAGVRIFLDHEYRRQGIGTLMLRSLIEIAPRVGLQQLYAEILSTQYQVVKAFEDLGFKHQAILPDYFITDTGETLDMDIMMLRLGDHAGEF